MGFERKYCRMTHACSRSDTRQTRIHRTPLPTPPSNMAEIQSGNEELPTLRGLCERWRNEEQQEVETCGYESSLDNMRQYPRIQC